jgi:hypothetical protein
MQAAWAMQWRINRLKRPAAVQGIAQSAAKRSAVFDSIISNFSEELSTMSGQLDICAVAKDWWRRR